MNGTQIRQGQLMTWQYWTVSEKRRANAERLTSCLPRLRDLSRMLVFGLHHISQISNFNTPFASGGSCKQRNTVLVCKIRSEKETAILEKLGCGVAQLLVRSACCRADPSSILGSLVSKKAMRIQQRQASANGEG
jgi:hypothetical protein